MIVRTVAARGTRAATRSAFTLMEIMVVVAIIVILAGISVVAVTGYMERARVDATKAKLHTVETAVSDYNNRHHEYPANLEVLTQRDGALPAYLDHDSIFDEWGHEIILDPNQRHPQTDRPLIYSQGPNPGDASSRISNW
jgi:general secretion pathway protein G